MSPMGWGSSTSAWALSMAVTLAAACSAGDEERSGAGPSLGGGGSSGSSGGVGGSGSFGNTDGGLVMLGDGSVGGGGGAGGGDADEDDAGLSEDNACGMGSAEAQLTPVNMLVMFDRSGSMEDDDKWTNATAALNAFLQSPDAAGLRVALRFFPHDLPAAGCRRQTNGAANCDAVACSQPLVDIGELSAEPAPTDAHEDALLQAIVSANPALDGSSGGGTPIYAALDGALRWATAHKASAPDENTVVIFLTDGEPNGCDESFANISALASTALADSGVTTYAIGLEGSSESQMDQLAAAGGTTQGIYIGNGANAQQELLDALNAIRGQTLACDFPMPEPTDASMAIDPSKVNVTFTPGNGMAATLRQVSDEAGCGDRKAWYYDDPSAPERIVLCPGACDLVRQTPDAQLEILLGCETACGGLEEDCGGTPPEVPPLIVD